MLNSVGRVRLQSLGIRAERRTTVASLVMEQEADLSTSSSEHLATVTTGNVANTSAQKKKSAKSRLAQPFKSLVGRSASLRSKPDEEAGGEASGADTLPRAATKPKKLDKKAKKAMQSGDESKSKEPVSAGEDLSTEDGKRNRKKKSSIVRRLSNKIRTSKPEQESGATSEMSAADQTSEDAHSMTSSSTYGAKTPEHASAPPPSSGGKESEEEWVSSKEATSEPEKTEPEPPPTPSPVETPVSKPRETPPPPPQATPEPLQAPTPEPAQPVLAAVRLEETVPTAQEQPSENGAGNPLTSTDPPVFPPTTDLAQNGERREHLYKILVIGELGTGKTSIIKRYVHQFFSQHYRATIGVDFALKVLTWDQNTIIRLQLWDIAGQERFGNMTRVYYKEAVGAFIVFDVTRTATFEAVLKWKADLDSKVQLPDGSPIPCVLLANKCDQQKEGIANTPAKMDEYCKENGFSGWYETSAKENINIDDAARFLVSKILQNDKVANVTSNKEDGFSLDKPEGEQNQKSCAC